MSLFLPERALASVRTLNDDQLRRAFYDTVLNGKRPLICGEQEDNACYDIFVALCQTPRAAAVIRGASDVIDKLASLISEDPIDLTDHQATAIYDLTNFISIVAPAELRNDVLALLEIAKKKNAPTTVLNPVTRAAQAYLTPVP